MAVLRVIFALTLLSYAMVQARSSHNNAVIIDNDKDVIRDNVGIANGTEITIQQAPYVVALLYNDQVFGAGSIVHEQFILTSASVVKNMTDSFQILYGTATRDCDGGLMMPVAERLCHEHYCPKNGSDNDICLLKLKGRIPLGTSTKIAKVDLPEKNIEFQMRTLFDVTGWGQEQQNHTHRDHLRRAEAELLVTNFCGEYYRYDFNMTENMICAGISQRGPCVGDGGAPLTLGNMQVGITFKENCGKFPSVFTKVSKFIPWINQTIANNL